MAYLSWISDEDLRTAVSHLMEKAADAQVKADKEFNKNVIDPFSALFQISGFNIDFEKWLVSEETRKAQKTLQNHIGEFHQIVLGSVDGWEDLKVGKQVDLVSRELKILVEVKNKYNTVKKDTLGALYQELEQLVMPKTSKYKNYTIYYVTIIPDKPERFDTPFTPSNKKTGTRFPNNDKIRTIDGTSFYSLVTKNENALEQLFDCLPNVISDCNDYKYSDKDKIALRNFFKLAYG